MRSCIQVTMAMDAKDLRTESALSERNNDGSKYSQSGGIALQCDRNKPYQDIGSNSLGKVDVQSARPCAVIGPDRVVPPPASNEAYLKKGPTETWPCMDNTYHTRRPPEYPHKLANYQNPTRNISPRQTYQENMQRIMVPPSYNSVKISDETNYAPPMSERSNILPKNIKLNVPPEAKFCEVPYSVYPTSTEQKNVRNPEMCLPNVNPTLTRTAPHGWPPGSVNIRPTRAYGAPELYQYQDYASCAGPRPVVQRPNRTVPEEPSYVYADPFYHQEGNIRFKPYPTVKERHPQQRYDYISNYANSFHPPPAFPSHKYDLQKPVPPHPYAPYPPIKYLDRVSEPVMEGYQRNQQGGYNMQPYRNQIIHPNYGPVLGNCPQNKIHSYPPDGHIKNIPPNKLPYDNTKAYIEYENGRPKMYPPSESYLINEMGRMHPMKSQVIMPNYPSINMHNIPPNPYHKKDSQQLKNYEYLQAHYRSMDPNMNMHNPMVRHPSVFSPNTLAISPTDSVASNDTSQTIGTSQEDCGYVSQSSSASVRSMDSGINRIPNDYIRKYYDSRFGPMIRTSSMMSKSDLNSNHNSKEKKNIDVRQFLQMWNEGDEEAEENTAKEIIVQTGGPKGSSSFSKSHEGMGQPNQEQLYVLGLVNVPSEELGKYEHIQKVSKLPENIKGYNHLELLNQFEEAIELSNMPTYKISPPNPKDFKTLPKGVPTKQATNIVPPRPLSPLDVEAKISQSVIHKEVGCNFEIKPCSPKMMNVEVATPAQNILAERAIEKVANPVMLKSPRLNSIDENMDCNIMKRKDHRLNINNEPVRIPSCKMVNTQFSDSSGIDSIKNTYSLQDLESNSGLCLASLPRLDNDIELNFPEVNQQFINANKRDSTVLTSSLKDLPSLEVLDQSERQNKDMNSLTRDNDFMSSPCTIDSEKEFSKLSKYRKSKTHLSGSKDSLNAVRTDSVIIKNPENSKNYEEHSVFSPNCLSKPMCDIQQTPMNLTSQVNVAEITENTIKPLVVGKELNSSIEIAIDFSLNKNTSNDNVECLGINNNLEIDNLKNSTSNVNQSTDKQLMQLPSFSDSDQNTQHAYIDYNKLEENIISSPTGSIHKEITSPKSLINSNDMNTVNTTDSPRPEQIFEKSDYLPTPNINEINNEDEYMSCISPVKVMNDINTNSLIPMEFETPPEEVLRTADSDVGNYFTKNTDSSKTCLEVENSNITKDEVKDKKYQPDDSIKINQKCEVDNDTTSKEESKGGNVAGCDTVNEDIESESETVAPKHSLSRYPNESPIFEVSGKIDCDLSNQEMGRNFYQSDDILQKNNTDSILSPLSSIGSSIRDDYHSDTERIPDTLDFPSSNNIPAHSPTDALLDGTECDIDSNFDKSPNNITVDNRVDRVETKNEEHNANFDISSNNIELTNNRDNDLSKVTTMKDCEDESNSKAHSSNDIVTLTPDIPKHSNVENDNSCVPSNIETHDQNNDLLHSNKTPTNMPKHSNLENDGKSDTSNIEAHDKDIDLSFSNITPMDMPKHSDVENDNSSVPSNIETHDKDNDLSFSNITPIDMPKHSNVENDNSSVPSNIETHDKDNDLSFPNITPIDMPKHSNVENDNSSVPSNIETHDKDNDLSFSDITPTDMPKHSNVENDNSSVSSNVETHDEDNDLSFSNITPIDMPKHSNVENDNSSVSSNVETHDEDNDLSFSNITPIDMPKHSNVKNYNSSVPSNVETHEQDNDLSYSNMTLINMPKHSNVENDNISVPSNIETHDEDNDLSYSNITPIGMPKHNIVENDNSPVPSNKNTHDQDNLSFSNITPIDMPKHSNVKIDNSSVLNNIETHNQDNDLSDSNITQIESSLSLPSPNNKNQPLTIPQETNCPTNDIVTKNINYDIEKENYGLDFLKDISDEPDGDKNPKDICIANDKVTSVETTCFAKSSIEELNIVNQRIRYLAYGSKKMYSPWIQKLIMFCEGNIGPAKSNIKDENSRNSRSPENEYSCCFVNSEMHQSNSGVHNANNSILPNVKNCLVETSNLYLSDSLDTENNSKIDEDNIYEDTCITNNENIVEPNKHTKPSPFHEEKESFAPVKSVDNVEDTNKDITKPSLMSSILNDTTHNLTNHYDKLDNSHTNPERDSCYSPPSISKDWDKKSICSDEIREDMDQQSHCNEDIAAQWDKEYDCDAEILEQWDRQSNFNDDVLGQWDDASDSKDDASKHSVHHQSSHKQDDDDEVPGQVISEQLNDVEVFEEPDKHSDCNDSEIEPSTTVEINDISCTNVQTGHANLYNKNRQPLKRSLSDSALSIYNSNKQQQAQENEESVHFIWPFKRRKMNNLENDMLAQNLCNIIQSNRRNSISSIYNEENVSFCILIDNSCIIAEEENDDQEKICYTELPEDCLAEMHNDCTKQEENSELMTDVITTQESEQCEEYSDSYVMQDEDEKVEESWVEDVACVETVISDDIAEDIEISGSSSPKDDELSDNDESGVFSSSEHTDKVKYIYGGKMCNDDAQFVETLYNTPQMDVNKTLVQRETLISGEYYDNDSLEKILSESNDREPPYVSPYVPDYTEPVFSPKIINVKETIDNKENMDVESISPLQSNANSLDVVDTGIDNTKYDNVTKGKLLKKAQESTVHSCESSVDNVFTYKENDDIASYTSSSPEVSSTTSEEKNSSILLKITNYKGSRISQINDISRDNTRPSCKFTEDQDYVQSHSNFPSHRPLLTKAAQKYIPPLKESMRDLKVKLSLPQHSLMKLKQLKKSKDKPKVCKQNIPVPRVSKKPKPKFEDVLKSIDEIHFKMHKEKTKKTKKSIPKVVIKKNQNGSHYASTSNKDEFNPDLTGRKWQPWVFIEKNHFIDKMAIKNKTKAVYSHRKKTYVLAEKFYKYRSANSAKFVISPPISDSPPTGLKYTIRLKHSY